MIRWIDRCSETVTVASRFCHGEQANKYLRMASDLTAILLSSVFLGVGFVITKYFPEASLLAGVFLVGLAVLNIALAVAT